MDKDELYGGDRGEYYHAQRSSLRSEEAQRERAMFFADVADERVTILDFGCGTGGVLSSLKAARRIGVEISPFAAKEAKEKLDQVVSDLEEIPNESIDVVISFHALEHVENPGLVLRGLYRVMRSGGRIKIIVPCEMPLLLADHRTWVAGDVNMHLQAWTPLTLGNLLTFCGFQVRNASMQPASLGGRLGRRLPRNNWVRNGLVQFKSMANGMYHTVVTGEKRAP